MANRYVLETRTRAEVNVRPRPLVNVNRREDKARPDKTALWKFMCVDNETWTVHGFPTIRRRLSGSCMKARSRDLTRGTLTKLRWVCFHRRRHGEREQESWDPMALGSRRRVNSYWGALPMSHARRVRPCASGIRACWHDFRVSVS